MSTESYKIIGLMSGTSLDGLDIAYCHFRKTQDKWIFTIPYADSIDYEQAFKKELKNTVSLPASQLLSFNNMYGKWLGDQTKEFIVKNNIEVDFISSHGHTIFHQPEIGLTYQIGSGQHLANASGHKVICDFRTNDVALGGQGAPLVPIGDQLLFGSYDFCLNLGGISNISFESNKKRVAYDISPVNMLLNLICSFINKEYDDKGQIARSGKINNSLLNKLNSLAYYQLPHPKSLGFEWFTENIIPIIKNTNDSVENLLYTSVHHIATQIANTIIGTQQKNITILITGGGAKNEFLIEIIKNKLQDIATIVVPDIDTIDYKEALIFAFMGVLKERNEINCLKSVTGARKNSSSGVIFFPS
ncbi:anhydro-N-acetylmuramic acid kinase [Aquimarina sp. 2201CG5-10]|uniref:anhydro-N-acetylmuramic acid kinase n=1 Tax=Aquimarina callyspongiae TaxID=3098150 RepID=UPI002AB3D2DF|nr:anhydro-N-acetylmuramic acid kinase [Aquimarina sp. 2201CG5-10]MDY8137631.1 anhydro-N-acetylmuramic acid kinase [Aquimarina sp. 2201CG5-10]